MFIVTFCNTNSLQCEHCGLVTPKFIYTQHHGDSCKENPNRSQESINKTNERNNKIRYVQLSEEFKKEHSVICEHCNNTVLKSTYAQYHGEHCKQNPTRTIESISRDKIKAENHRKLITSKEYIDKNSIQCIYCGKVTISAIHARFHGENCKQNPNRSEESINNEKEYSIILSKAQKSLEVIEKTTVVCEYCNTSVRSNIYNTRHGEHCKQNPNRSAESIHMAETINANMSKSHYTNEYFKRNTNTCVHCNKTIVGNPSNFHRHHNDNCKMNPTYTPKEKAKYTCMCGKVFSFKKSHEKHISTCPINS